MGHIGETQRGKQIAVRVAEHDLPIRDDRVGDQSDPVPSPDRDQLPSLVHLVDPEIREIDRRGDLSIEPDAVISEAPGDLLRCGGDDLVRLRPLVRGIHKRVHRARLIDPPGIGAVIGSAHEQLPNRWGVVDCYRLTELIALLPVVDRHFGCQRPCAPDPVVDVDRSLPLPCMDVIVRVIFRSADRDPIPIN